MTSSFITLLTPLIISLALTLISWIWTYSSENKLYLHLIFIGFIPFGFIYNTLSLFNIYDGWTPWDKSYKNWINELNDEDFKKERNFQMKMGAVLFIAFFLIGYLGDWKTQNFHKILWEKGDFKELQQQQQKPFRGQV